MAILSADKIIFPLCCIQVIFLALTCDAISEGFDAQPRVPTVTPKLQERYTPARNYPGMADFPSQVEFKKLAATLQGDVVTPVSEYYKYLAVMYNVRTTRFPYAIYLVESVEDVQKVMLFAKKHNLMVTIQSSGHSYIGRSTYDGSVQINFKKMKGRQINLQSTRSEAGEITVESGNTWLEVYTEVDKVVTATNGTQRQRVIVGGSAHTVAMGGYTQGGGHSPVCRSLGMAVDNLLEATLVTAEGKIVTVSEEGSVIKDIDGTVTENCDASLFWAIRGGGGGAWGAVTSFTFKLHYAPERFRVVYASWVLRAGKEEQFGRDTVAFVLKGLNQLCPQWGGYLLASGGAVDPQAFYSGILTVYLNHFGSGSDVCNKDIDGILNYNISGNQYVKSDRNFSTFLEYERTAYDPPAVNAYIVNTFVQPAAVNDSVKLAALVDTLMGLDASDSCTGVMIGGAMNQSKPGSTPVNPSFRSGLMSMTCGVGWDSKFTNDSLYVDKALKLGQRLLEVGTGVYYNECNEDLDNWKEEFWGGKDTYCKLAAIKRKLDPDNFLWCHNCVGSDFKFGCPKYYWWQRDNPWAYRQAKRGRHVSELEYRLAKSLSS